MEVYGQAQWGQDWRPRVDGGGLLSVGKSAGSSVMMSCFGIFGTSTLKQCYLMWDVIEDEQQRKGSGIWHSQKAKRRWRGADLKAAYLRRLVLVGCPHCKGWQNAEFQGHTVTILSIGRNRLERERERASIQSSFILLNSSKV